jgi:hypothetical protein
LASYFFWEILSFWFSSFVLSEISFQYCYCEHDLCMDWNWLVRFLFCEYMSKSFVSHFTYNMVKIRLFCSSIMALILPRSKDITNFVLKLFCSLFTLFINSVCLSLCPCPWLSQVFGVIRTRPIHLTI